MQNDIEFEYNYTDTKSEVAMSMDKFGRDILTLENFIKLINTKHKDFSSIRHNKFYLIEKVSNNTFIKYSANFLELPGKE